MDIPSLPTDNLYKFIALSGILIIVLSSTYYFYKYDNVKDEIRKIEMQTAKLEVNSNHLIEKKELLLKKINAHDKLIERLNKNIDKDLKEAKKENEYLEKELKMKYNTKRLDTIHFSEPIFDKDYREVLKFLYDYPLYFDPNYNDRNDLKKNWNDVELRYMQLDETTEKIELTSVEIRQNIKNLEMESKSLTDLIIKYGICLFFGIGLMIFGFYQWYKKLQKPMDEKLSYEMELAKLNYDNANKVK